MSWKQDPIQKAGERLVQDQQVPIHGELSLVAVRVIAAADVDEDVVGGWLSMVALALLVLGSIRWALV